MKLQEEPRPPKCTQSVGCKTKSRVPDSHEYLPEVLTDSTRKDVVSRDQKKQLTYVSHAAPLPFYICRGEGTITSANHLMYTFFTPSAHLLYTFSHRHLLYTRLTSILFDKHLRPIVSHNTLRRYFFEVVEDQTKAEHSHVVTLRHGLPHAGPFRLSPVHLVTKPG